MTTASGSLAGFGFAEFEDPEVVLRCLKCLNGTELPDMTPAGRREGVTKALVVRPTLVVVDRHRPDLLMITQVKADDKTKAFLNEFEELDIRTDVSRRRRRDPGAFSNGLVALIITA